MQLVNLIKAKQTMVNTAFVHKEAWSLFASYLETFIFDVSIVNADNERSLLTFQESKTFVHDS